MGQTKEKSSAAEAKAPARQKKAQKRTNRSHTEEITGGTSMEQQNIQNSRRRHSLIQRNSLSLAFFLGTALLLLLFASSAYADSYFRGDLRHRPRLAFDGRDGAHIARVIQRINNDETPWSSAYRALRDLAEKGSVVNHRNSGWEKKDDKYAVLYGQEAKNGRIASAKAFVAWLYSRGLDPAWRPLPRLPGHSSPREWVKRQAADAARVIESMYDDWPCYRGFSVINRGIVAADSLVMHCVAFDLLSALPASLRPSLGKAEECLGNLASDFQYWYFTVDGYDNNHPIRVSSALGVAAVAINRHDRYRWWKPGTWWHRPSKWIAKAEKELHPVRRSSNLYYQLRRGACAEGTGYHQYAGDLYMPFFFAYNRFLSGGGVPFLQSNLVTEGERWEVQLRLPDGRRPVIDNSRLLRDTMPAYFLSRARGGVRSAADRTLFLWDWKRAGYPGIGGRQAIFLLAAYDPTPQQLQVADAMSGPSLAPTRFLSTQGQAILRTGWGKDDAFALVMAEHGEVRKRGKGHEAVDNGAYTFYAHGDLVTIDPGYAGFSQVERTNKGEDRSMVLVNGKAPKPAHKRLGFLDWVSGGEDAYIVSGARTRNGSSIRSVEVKSTYRSARIRRTIALVEKRYLIVEDLCKNRWWWKKTFTTQVQTNGGAAKNRPLQVSGSTVRYRTNRKSLPVCVGAAATAPLSTRVTSRFDSFGENPKGHDAIEYSTRGREVIFLTAIAANPQGGAQPIVEPIPVKGGAAVLWIKAGGRYDMVIANPRKAHITVPATAYTRTITTRCELVVVSFDPSGSHRILWRVGSGNVAIR
jgi:hypothetical protein